MHHEHTDDTPPISQAQLLEHLSLSKSSTHLIGETGLVPIGGKYPWRRIWRAVHHIEGAHLAGHFALLKARHPDSPILSRIVDLEAALKSPLWDFPRLALEMGWTYDAYRKAIKEGRVMLPAAMIKLGGRKKMFRPLEVILMRDEGIALELPSATIVATKRTPDAISKPKAPASRPSSPATQSTPESQPTTGKKAIFGAFAGGKRTTVA